MKARRGRHVEAISLLDSSTWPLLLTIEQYAAIQQATPSAIYERIRRGRCFPPPILAHEGTGYALPYRWRKAQLVEYVEGRSSARVFGRKAG